MHSFPDNCFYRVSVKALIKNNEGKIMLLKEPDDTWDLPGWGWENGETAHKALERELDEEIGVKLVSSSLLPVMMRSCINSKGIWRLLLVFEVVVDTFDVKLAGWYEAVAMEFFSKEEIEVGVAKLHPICLGLKGFL